MLRKVLIKQLLLPFIGKDNVYSIFDRNKIIYIHVPKVAGTSICEAVFGEDPWHYSASELKLINRSKFNSYSKVVFVRNPIDRLISTYLYSKKHIKDNPNTSIKFMESCTSFDDFVENYLDKKLVNQHYFFWTQSKYAGEGVDFVGKFENLDSDFKLFCEKFELHTYLPHKNKSNELKSKIKIKQCNFNKILELYQCDFERFEYAEYSEKLDVI